MKKENLELELLKQIRGIKTPQSAFEYVFDNMFTIYTQIELVKEKQRCVRENLPFDFSEFSNQTKDLVKKDLINTEYCYLIDEWKI